MLTTAVVTAVLAFIVFLIIQIVLVDISEEILQAGLSSPDVNAATGLNYITWIYILAVITSSLAANQVFFGKQSIIPGLFASGCTIVTLYFLSFVTFTVAYPAITLNVLGIVSAPTLFLSYILKDIFMFQVIVVVVQVMFFTVLNQIMLNNDK